MNLPRLEELMKSIADLKTQQQSEVSETGESIVTSSDIQQLHTQLITEFGPYIEDALFNVYDEYCPDDEMKPLLEYLPTSLECTGVNGHTQYIMPHGQGVEVDADDYPGQHTRLGLVPNPTRVVLKVQETDLEEVVWVARELSES